MAGASTITPGGEEFLLNLTATQTLWIGLNSNFSDTGAFELSGGTPAYARRLVNWTQPSANLRSLSGSANFDVPAGSDVRAFSLWTTQTGGTCISAASCTPAYHAAQATYLLIVQGQVVQNDAAILAVPGVQTINNKSGITVTLTAGDVGAETPEAAQVKADGALTSATALVNAETVARQAEIAALVLSGGGITSINGVGPVGSAVTLTPANLGAIASPSGVDTAGSPLVSTGAGLFKRGHPVFDVVNRYNADPTGVASSAAAFAAAFADAATAGKGAILVPAGVYKLDSATRLSMLNDVSLIGEGAGATELSFTHINGGLNCGVRGTLSLGGSLRGFTMRGGNVVRNMLKFGHISGWVIEDLELVQGGYDVANPDNSAAVIFEEAGNLDIRNVRVNNNRGHGVIADMGSGGHTWKRGRIGGCGTAGAAVYNFWARRTDLTPGLVYAGYPADWIMENVFIEQAGSGQAYLVRLDAAKDFRWSFSGTAEDSAPANITIVYVGADTQKILFDGTQLTGIAGAGNVGVPSVAGMTLIEIALGNTETIFAGKPSYFSGAGIAFKVANGPDLKLMVEPKFTTTITTKYSGTVSRITRSYAQRFLGSTSPTPTVAGEDNRLVPQLALSTLGTDNDQYILPMRTSASAFMFADLLNTGSFREYAPNPSSNPVVPGSQVRKGEIIVNAGLLYKALAYINSTVGTFNASLFQQLTFPPVGLDEPVYTNATPGATLDLSVLPLYAYYDLTLTNTTLACTIPAAAAGRSELFNIKQSTVGLRTVTFSVPAGDTLIWEAGAAPVQSTGLGKQDRYLFYSLNTSVVYGRVTVEGIVG